MQRPDDDGQSLSDALLGSDEHPGAVGPRPHRLMATTASSPLRAISSFSWEVAQDPQPMMLLSRRCIPAAATPSAPASRIRGQAGVVLPAVHFSRFVAVGRGPGAARRPAGLMRQTVRAMASPGKVDIHAATQSLLRPSGQHSAPTRLRNRPRRDPGRKLRAASSTPRHPPNLGSADTT